MTKYNKKSDENTELLKFNVVKQFEYLVTMTSRGRSVSVSSNDQCRFILVNFIRLTWAVCLCAAQLKRILCIYYAHIPPHLTSKTTVFLLAYSGHFFKHVIPVHIGRNNL